MCGPYAWRGAQYGHFTSCTLPTTQLAFTWKVTVYDVERSHDVDDVKDLRCQMSAATVVLVYVCYGAIVISINYAMVAEHLLCLGRFD